MLHVFPQPGRNRSFGASARPSKQLLKQVIGSAIRDDRFPGRDHFPAEQLHAGGAASGTSAAAAGGEEHFGDARARCDFGAGVASGGGDLR